MAATILVDADVKQLTTGQGRRHRRRGRDRRQAASRSRARKGVILATGGFDWAPDYMPKHFPGIDLIGAPDTNTGDGQRMAAEVGAELAHMDQANIAPATFTQLRGPPPCAAAVRELRAALHPGEPRGRALRERGQRLARVGDRRARARRQAEARCRCGASSIRATATGCRRCTCRQGSDLRAHAPTRSRRWRRRSASIPQRCAQRSIASTAGRRRASTATSIAARRRGSATTPRTARSTRSSRGRSTRRHSSM